MVHPLVSQLRFTRSEWRRALVRVTDADARIRFEPMNCISWMVGHLTWHENLYWMRYAQGQNLVPELSTLVASGRPSSTPPLDEMWAAWRLVTGASEELLNTLTSDQLATYFTYKGKAASESIGTMLHRLAYHYWFHIGEALAVRQLLGHENLPEFVGDISLHAPYRPESQGT